MEKFYTRACNFSYKKVNSKKKSYNLSGNKNITFDTIELITRTKKKKLI